MSASLAFWWFWISWMRFCHLAFSWSGSLFICRFQWSLAGLQQGLGLSSILLNHMRSREKPMGKAQIVDAIVNRHACMHFVSPNIPISFKYSWWTFITVSAQLFMEICSHISLLMVLARSVLCFCRFSGTNPWKIWPLMYVPIINFHISLVVLSLVFFFFFSNLFNLIWKVTNITIGK